MVFTGIIENRGRVRSLIRNRGQNRLEIEAGWTDLETGESVSVDGVCLTVAVLHPDGFGADLSAETLRRTIIGRYRSGQLVNLERALRLGDRLGGHLVYGHVDGVGQVGRIVKRPDYWDMEISVERNIRKYLAEKASVAVNGVSLTVARRLPDGFWLSLIPHTLKATTIGQWRTGDPVNIEVDKVAKYIESLVGAR